MNKQNKIYPYYEYGNNGNISYFEDSNGYWYKKEYDDRDKLIYFEHSRGFIIMGNLNNGIRVRIR